MIGTDTRKIASEYRLAQWAQVMQSRMNRGQSITDFCSSEGLSKNTYFYWQRKLRAAACAGSAGEVSEPGSALVPRGWTRLESEMATPQSKDASLVIEVGGCRVSVDAQTDPELLAKVCRALKSV